MENLMNKVGIYHANCLDGITAATIMSMKYPTSTLAKGYYQTEPNWELIEGAQVFLLDFSFKHDVMVKVLDVAAEVILLDHHDTALDDLKPLEGHPKFHTQHSTNENSGAVIAWNYFFPNQPVLKLVSHVEDRDLWKFNMPETRAICAALYSYELTVETFKRLFSRKLESLVTEGHPLLRAHDKEVARLVPKASRAILPGGENVPILNLAPEYTSDVLNELAKSDIFAMGYVITKDRVLFSLRAQDTIHVGKFCESLGGGGHRNAAGFSFSLLEGLEYLGNILEPLAGDQVSYMKKQKGD
jgi:uncharacterized protein